MALPTAAPERQLLHRRSIDVLICARDDRLWEVGAHITDVRTHEARMATGMLSAGSPIHDVLLRLVKGCTRITEMSRVLPTAVVQALAGQILDTRGDAAESQQPFQIDRCHAPRADGLAVKTYYPRWYRAALATPETVIRETP